MRTAARQFRAAVLIIKQSSPDINPAAATLRHQATTPRPLLDGPLSAEALGEKAGLPLSRSLISLNAQFHADHPTVYLRKGASERACAQARGGCLGLPVDRPEPPPLCPNPGTDHACHVMASRGGQRRPRDDDEEDDEEEEEEEDGRRPESPALLNPVKAEPGGNLRTGRFSKSPLAGVASGQGERTSAAAAQPPAGILPRSISKSPPPVMPPGGRSCNASPDSPACETLRGLVVRRVLSLVDGLS
jgi:hypothetical protein